MDTIVILLFVATLAVCVILGQPTALALAIGYVIFFVYALRRGVPAEKIFRLSFAGIKKSFTVISTVSMIGIMTGVWRVSGTIPTIVALASRIIRPEAFLPLTFLLCSLMSFLMGTAFGTAASMGVICATMGSSMGVPPLLTGGAVLSGVFFGDRCSPVSTSALLVASLTETDLLSNIRGMMKTAAVPFAATTLLYAVLGLAVSAQGVTTDAAALFGQAFRLHWVLLIPAILVLGLTICRVPVRKAILFSLLLASVLAFVLQGASLKEIFIALAVGYHTDDPTLEAMLGGGGAYSMIKAMLIVTISSCYGGIFEETGLLNGIREVIAKLAKRTSVLGSTLVASVFTSMLACNQTFAIMLTDQLCGGLIDDKEQKAMNMENTVVLVAGLIPWSIAGAVPLATVGSPLSSMLVAFYLYLVPLWQFVVQWLNRRKA